MRQLLVPGLALAALVFAPGAEAQNPPSTEQGVVPFGTYEGGDIDRIDVITGNLFVHIPLLSYPQRGSLKLSFSLQSNNKGWVVADMNDPPLTPFWSQGNAYLASVEAVYDQAWSGFMTGSCGPPHAPNPTFSFHVQGPDGRRHGLGLVSGTKPTSCTSFGPLTMETYDGTGVRVSGSYPGTDTVIGPDGEIYQGLAGGRTDTNGNEISVDANGVLTDTLGRSIPQPPVAPNFGTQTTNYSGCSGPQPIASATLWSPPSPNGGTETYKFCYVTVTVQTAFDVPGITDAPADGVTFLQSVVLPNNTTWTFEYNTYGDLAEIVLPTGGSISYGYINWMGTYVGGSPRSVSSRTINANDGTGPHTWNYQWGTLNTSNHTYTVTSTDPLGNATVYTNTLVASPVVGGPYETTLKQVYQGSASGTPLETIATNWQLTTAQIIDSAPPFPSAFPTQVTTSWANGQTKQTTKTYDSGLTWANGVVGSFGKVIGEADSDYGTGAPGSLLRSISTGYLWQSGSTYLNANFLDFVSSVQVSNGSAQVAYETIGYDETAAVASNISTQHASAPNGNTVRGNATSIHKWLNTSGGYLVDTITNFDTGEVQTSADPRGNATTYAYSSTYAGAYATTITNALQQSLSYSYDFETGLQTSITDPNGQTINISYDDQTWRKIQTSYPDGGQNNFCYSDTPSEGCASGPPYQVTVTKKITPSLNFVTTAVLDGLGRPTKTELTSDPSGTDYTLITYDADGRQASETNPYRTTSDPTYGITSYQYDALNRPLLVTNADGSKVTTTYTGNCTTVTDEAGKTRESCTDGLGRMTEVIENPGGLGYVTNYGFDALGDLTSVVQGGSHNRSFVYDSLKRLVSSTNPEAGTISYTYDGDGNVLTKTDARGIVTNYSPTSSPIDKLNRVTSKTYSDGSPTVTYTYDQTTCGVVSHCYNIGRMTGMTDAAGSESFAYDTMGRLWGDTRTTNSITKNTSYVYNLDGSLATLNYPSGHSIGYTVGGAGLPLAAADSALTSAAYAASGQYTAWGARNWTTYGGYIGENILFNTRLQPCWTFVSSVAGISTTSCTGSETSSGNLMDVQYNFNVGADNGNLVGITNHRNSNRSQSYGYDAVNRISNAATLSTCTANCWNLIFTLDQWANLTTVSGTGNATLTPNAKNQISVGPFTYDASGNELTDVTSTYAWNAESEMKSGGGVTYVYDGRGNRVEKSGLKLYWHGPNGEVLDETDTTGSTANTTFGEYVYFDGSRVARRDYLNNVYYYFEDQINSSRAIAEMPAGSTTVTLCYDADFYPYGGETDFTSTCAQNYKFEGNERDSETGNDYFGARFYSSAYGRFLSPDWSSVPAAVPYADLSNPQTLNLYAFVTNNPESFVDLGGHVQTGDEIKSNFDDLEQQNDAVVPALRIPLWQGLLNWLFGGSGDPQATAQTNNPLTNQIVRNEIASIAEKYQGRTDWAFAVQKGIYGCNTNKCNVFVGDVTRAAGAPVSITVKGVTRYPLAGELADRSTPIANWRVLRVGERPQPGDIAAYKLPGHASYTGHSGIVTSVDADGTVHAMAAHETVIGPDEKFNPGIGAAVITYRRFTGDQ
jgi:RHS repeat-associated protein